MDFLSLILQKQRDEVGWIVELGIVADDDFGVDVGMILSARFVIVSLTNGQGSITPSQGMCLTGKGRVLTFCDQVVNWCGR